MGTVFLFGNRALLQTLELWARFLLAAHIIIAGAFLWNSAHGNATMRHSLGNLLRKDLSIHFYLIAVGLGLTVPFIITLAAFSGPIPDGLIWLRLFCAVVGDAAFRYCIFKAGEYTPLVPV